MFLERQPAVVLSFPNNKTDRGMKGNTTAGLWLEHISPPWSKRVSMCQREIDRCEFSKEKRKGKLTVYIATLDTWN